ncbi:unnamed protein product [Parnassius mnemosyne]|uniref:Gustatory receptor n=1 Tax=Parnassius mnemosyne TaxID=213953 RepID=A0AAV1K8G9_9NEOP
MVHLIIHLFLLLAFLKVINIKLSQLLTFNRGRATDPNVSYLEPMQKRKRSFAYLCNTNISFIEINPQKGDLKSLCLFYDDISSCIRLLEINHGSQVFLIVWLMFSNTVIGVTMIIVTEKILPWLVISKSAELFIWYYLACYISEQIGNEVKETELLIIKHVIDFRCDEPKRNLLMTFKQLVSSYQIRFTACNLFHLNYGTMLGTIVSVITYSIILNQLFWSG